MLKKIIMLKILIFIPLILISINMSAIKETKSSSLQKLVKNILISELGIGDKLSHEIDPAKLPCKGLFEYFKTKDTNKEFIYALNPFTIIAGSDSFQEIQKELSNANHHKYLTIELIKNILIVKQGNTLKEINCEKLLRRPC